MYKTSPSPQRPCTLPRAAPSPPACGHCPGHPTPPPSAISLPPSSGSDCSCPLISTLFVTSPPIKQTGTHTKAGPPGLLPALPTSTYPLWHPCDITAHCTSLSTSLSLPMTLLTLHRPTPAPHTALTTFQHYPTPLEWTPRGRLSPVLLHPGQICAP